MQPSDESEALYRALVDAILDVVLTLTPDGRVAEVNPAFEALTGWSREEWIGQSFSALLHPDDRPPAAKHLQQAAAGTPAAFGARLKRDAADYLLGHCTLVPVPCGRPPATILGIVRDVTELRKLQVFEREAARTDHLTQLANRRGSEEALAREVARASRENSTVGIVLFDIDHFKQVNDTFGHDTGDVVLRAVAGVLRQALRPFDIAGRWGGEELIAILPGASLHGARQSGERVRADVAALAGLPTKVTISAGTAEWTRGQDAAAALARADTQLYAAKTGGRNRVC